MPNESPGLLDELQRTGMSVPAAGSRHVRTSPEEFMRKNKGKHGIKPKTMDVKEVSQRLAFGVRGFSENLPDKRGNDGRFGDLRERGQRRGRNFSLLMTQKLS